MKRIMGRMNGLIRIAKKRQEKGSEIDKLVGRQIERNLKMAKRIIGEEIVCCQDCICCITLDCAVEIGEITKEEAERYQTENQCLCLRYKRPKKLSDFCSEGERDETC